MQQSRYLQIFFCLTLILLGQNTFGQMIPPIQNAPDDNDTGTSTSPYFYIASISSSAEQVVVEYSESITMSSPTRLVRDQFNTATFLYAAKLKLNTDYYWRVKEVGSTDSSAWSTILKFTTTAIFRTIQPSNNVTTLGASFLTFRANKVFQYDTVLWEIDTTTNFNSTLLRSIALPDTGSYHEVVTTQENFNYGQQYFWRARAYSGSNTSTWTQTRYFITGDTVGLRYPTPDWLQDVEEDVEFLSWRDDEAVQIQLDTSPSFTSLQLDTFLADGVKEYLGQRFKLTQLDYETNYYYRVRSYNAADTTPWSYSNFTTKGLATDVVIADNYADPIITLRNRTSIDGSEGYQLVLDTSENFDSPIFHTRYASDGRDTVADLFFGATYYTKARPYHSKDTGEWTRTRPIRITPFPATYYPFRNYTDIGIIDSMQIDNMEGVDAYQVQIADSGDYANRMFLDTTLLDSTEANYYFIKGLTFKFNTQYEWRIRGWHSEDTSVWSDSKKFTTVASPTLTRPFNSDFLGDQAELDLQWESMGNGIRYQVMMDTTELFNSPLLIDTEVDTNALSQEDLLFRPLYYWKVRAVTKDDTSKWSETWKFTVLQPRLNLPRNNRTNISLGITSLNWNSIDGTDGYILQLDSFSDFRNPEEFTDTVSNSFFHYFFEKPEILTFQTKYYWRVKLYHAKDTSDWSDVWNFTTLPRRAPVQVSPVDSAIDIAVIATLTWEVYSGAASYAVEYSKDSSFSTPTKTTSTTTNLKLTLEPSTRYYWRVRGRNSDGNEFYDWSEEWTFVTDAGLPVVSLISPANEAIDQPRDVVLRWNKNNDATSYRVELSQKEDFSGVFRNTATVAATNYNGLANGIKYYWRVKTISNALTSPWSEVWSFTVVEKTNATENINLEHIALYPNPGKDYVTVSGVSGSASITVFNSLGQIVTLPIKNNTLDIGTLTSGVYYVQVSENGELTSLPLVVSK